MSAWFKILVARSSGKSGTSSDRFSSKETIAHISGDLNIGVIRPAVTSRLLSQLVLGATRSVDHWHRKGRRNGELRMKTPHAYWCAPASAKHTTDTVVPTATVQVGS